MKIYFLTVVIFVAGSLNPGLFRASAELEVSAGFSIHSSADFYEPLSPQGTWVEAGASGRCWRPSGVAKEWRPYCNGRWEWTDCGWYWVSDEPWAWACYHYGTWAYDSDFGWVWVPGVEWAPAWVVWRTGGDHIGWAPCTPAGFTVEPSFFVFVESRHFHERVRPDTVIVNNTVIIKNTTEFKNTRREEKHFDGKSQSVMVNNGPPVDELEKATGKKFTAVPVREAARRTSASVPESLKRQTVEPKTTQKPRTVQEPLKPMPGENHEMPQSVSPKKEKEMPVQNEIPPEMKTPRNAPERKVMPPETATPQIPPERIAPPLNKELPLEKQQRHPNEVVPPVHEAVQPSPVVPSEHQVPHENGHEKDKDHGQENP